MDCEADWREGGEGGIERERDTHTHTNTQRVPQSPHLLWKPLENESLDALDGILLHHIPDEEDQAANVRDAGDKRIECLLGLHDGAQAAEVNHHDRVFP